ncbi:MAG: sel1 repeat family protein [Neisseriaceae bacterium]|nr:sel1 repeat family protein [Neisseriaceae bacterium]
MKQNALFLTVCFSMFLSPIALAKTAEDDFQQGLAAYEKQNYTQAALFMEKACNSNKAEACYNLGYLYRHGQGVPKDINKVVKLYEKSCNGNFVSACMNLGTLYFMGEEVPTNLPKAKTLFEKACNGNEEHACSKLGVMYLGIGVEEDIETAKKYFDKGCRLGDTTACSIIQQMNNKQNAK